MFLNLFLKDAGECTFSDTIMGAQKSLHQSVNKKIKENVQ